MTTNNLKIKLTTASLAKHLVPPSDPKKPTVIHDSELSGFGVYRSSDRPGSYFLHYRCNKRQRKTVLGRTNELNVANARDEAARIKLEARRGNDVIAERKLEQDQAKTLGEAYQEYQHLLMKKGSSPRTIEGYEMLNERFWKPMANTPLKDISKAELRRLHTKWGTHGNTIANHAMRLFRAVYNHALKTTDGLPPNPSVAVDYFPEKKTRKKLEWEDVPNWLTKVEALPNEIRQCFWLLLLYSGLRSSDACSIRWDEINGMFLHRPNPKGGSDFAFDLPLSLRLVEIIDKARVARDRDFSDSPYVFPANSASGHLSSTKEKSFNDVTPHMLRRTFATACVEAGLDPYTTKRLLNHRVSGGDVTALYVQPSKEFLLNKMGQVSEYIERMVDKLETKLIAVSVQEANEVDQNELQ